MASADKRTIEIAEAFNRFLETKDVSLIEQFTQDELEIALLQLMKEGDSPRYVAMQIRREKLKKIEHQEIEKWATWKHRITVFIGGLILVLVLLFLKLIYFS